MYCFSQDVNANLRNQTFSAKVIGISDGDTMEVLFRDKPIKIRLGHIDAPEKRGTQPFGNNSKKALSDLCFGKIVTVQSEKYDRYNRLIAVIITDKNKNGDTKHNGSNYDPALSFTLQISEFSFVCLH